MPFQCNLQRYSEAATPQMLPPPMPPPIYERVRPVWEGGEKLPLVVFLGVVNLLLVLTFKAVGGMDFKVGSPKP